MEKRNQTGNWREAAKRLFFDAQKNIKEISAITDISRKSISDYLRTLPGYAAERQRRKTETAQKRKDYQREWDRTHRQARYTVINGETIRMEHDMAARILSREKYR